MRRQRPQGQTAGSPGARQLKVIGRRPLEAAFEAALARSLRRHAPELDEERVALVREQAFRDFMRLVGSQVRSLRGISKRDFLADLEQSHAAVLREREEARRELARLEVRAAVVRRMEAPREAEGAGTPLNDGLQEIFQRAERGELAMEDLRQEVELAASQYASIDKERTLSEYERQIDLFQRRIAKLNESLKRSEQTIQELARSKQVDPGLASVYRSVQGLAADAQMREAKLDLLVKLFESNLALREQFGAGRAAAAPGA